MTTKELYNHFENNVYFTINWCTDLGIGDSLRNLRNEIKTVNEAPNPNPRCTNYPLRTFEYKDFRFVETLSTRAGAQGSVYYIPTGELIGTNAVFYNFSTFVWWFYNHR